MAKKRTEFKDIYKWDIKALFKSDEDWLKEVKSLEKKLKNYAKYEGHILDDATTLLEILTFDTDISKNMEKIYIYAHINNDADTTDIKYQEILGKAKNLYTKYLEVSSFIVPELLQADFSVVQKYIDQNQDLKPYERSLKHIYRYKPHILNQEVEKVLTNFAKLMDAPEEIAGSLTDSDFKFDSIKVNGKNVELTESNYAIYIRDNDCKVRKQAFTSLFKTYESFKNTIATILRNEVEKNVVNAKIRGYKDSLNASLYGNEIDEKVYYNLIDSIHQNLPSLYRYWDLKKKLLGLEEFHIYDTYADTFKGEGQKYTFEQAKDLVLKAVEPLGSEYHQDIIKAFEEGWIDSCNNEGKRGGAYCTACYEAHPYVLLSFEGILDDVSTLAHELGHAMHYYYACQNQTYQDYGYSIFVAEVASQTNEILLCRYLLDHTSDKNEKLKIIDNLLQKYKASIFRQTMFAEFELFIHNYTEQGEVLTHQNMSEKYYELNKLYFGENVVIDEPIKFEWERIPHFYMNFYVYQYATGFAAAISLANKIYEGDIKTRDKYLKFLQLGCTKNPLDSLKVAGIDLTKTEVFREAIQFMDQLIEEYKVLMGCDK